MSKKLHSKLLSIILCIAICCATLCGSLIAANAAAADYNGTYSISVGDDKQAVPFAATEVKAQVKFDLPAGFVGGQFTAKAQSNYTIGENATIVAATDADNNELTAEEITAKTTAGENGEAPAFEIVNKASDSDMMFRFTLDDFYTSITIEYTIVMSSYVSGGGTTKYAVDIEVDGANFGVNGDYADVTFNGSTVYFHTHYPYYYNKSETPDNAHTVFECGCYHCDITSNQLLPDYTLFDGAEQIYSGAPGWMGISGITVNYDEDGTFDLGVHAYTQYHTGEVYLLVTDDSGNEITRTSTYANADSSSLAGNGLHASAKMFTIENLSARDIEKELLFTLIALYNESEVMTVHNSRTVPFTLSNYCLKVVDGEAVWPEGTLNSQIEADKDVAAALYYYGASIDESVFDKNTSAGSSIEYVNANYDEWDGTKVEPTETDTEGNIVIRNAEQLAWIALDGGANTANKNYRVVEKSVFNMKGMDGITLGSTVAQVKATGNARVAENKYSAVQNWRSTTDSNTLAFQGNFDGNGLIAYNIYSYQYANAGLFPCVDPSTQGTITIKNVSVVASYIGAYHYTGGIVGLGDATAGTGKNLVFENCATKTSYLNDFNSTNNRTVGTIVGGLSHNGTLINNCLALNNEISSTGIIGGFFANTSDYGSNVTVSNSLSIGTAIAPTSVNVALGSKVANTTYTNVYDEDVDAATLGSAWFDTDTYPELSMFHKFSKQYVDENTHKVICVLKAGDNTCGLKGLTEEHTLVANDEGTAEVCECGYYEDIIGNSINPNNKTKVVWDGAIPKTPDAAAFTKGSGAIDDPYIITKPSQLWYIAQVANADSAGKYYKVDDSIGVFDLANINWGLSDNSSNFQGNLDGNGVELINFKGAGWHSALFPNVTGTVTIKNLKIKGAVVEPSGGNGGVLIASINGNATTNVTVSQCVVADSVVSAKTQAGAIVATAGNGPHLTINNCMVYNTTVTTTSTQSYDPGNCVLGLSWAAGNCSMSDSIILGLNPENRINNISNVYTDYSSATNANITKITDLNTLKGSGVVENLNLDNDVWFDTASYPELHIFHDMNTIYIDETAHQYVCQVFVDGTQCTVCQVATAHTMVDAEDGLSASCECGYSYEIKGIHAMDLPESILNRITSNSVYIERFATNTLFKKAYNEDVYGTDTEDNVFDMYATSLNLKVNPHIAFTFAFHGDYKTNKANITATFSVEGQVVATVTGSEMINNAGAGRYHLYRFKALPVSKLCKDVKVTVNYGGNTYDFGTYSAAGYAINAMNAGEDFQYHVNASMALVYYSEMLAKRQG